MTPAVLLRGVVLGFSIAAPVGPIGLLCIRRSLADGRTAGLVTGLGAATADAMYGGVAAFGLTAVSGFLVAQKFWLGLLGGLFLCYLGLRTFVSAPKDRRHGRAKAALRRILSFVAIFAGLGIGAAADYSSAAALVAGVFLGSALWWVILSTGTGLAGKRLTGGWMRVVNHVSGAMIFAFGFYAIVASFKK